MNSSPVLKSEVTPLPWTYLKRKTLIHVESSIDASAAGEPVCSVPVSSEANAAFLVRAANSHEALVTFAHNVLAALEENGSEANIPNIIADARELLSKAKEA